VRAAAERPDRWAATGGLRFAMADIRFYSVSDEFGDFSNFAEAWLIALCSMLPPLSA
jgi:predicted NAD-dependent protein-ADP-ribosyltransferase YbiA (DUF1768 family)